MRHIPIRALLLAAVGLTVLAIGYERGRAHDRDRFDELPEPAATNVVGTWTGGLTSARSGAGTATLIITTQNGERFTGTIALSLPSSSILATSTAHGRISDSGRISVESYTAAGNLFANGPFVNNVMDLGYLLEMPDGTMDAGLMSLSLTTTTTTP